MPFSSPPEATAPLAIDWAKEAERAAADRIEADEEVRRGSSARPPDGGQNVGIAGGGAPSVQFGWDYAHIHRFEALPEGGSILNLNDRCSIIIKLPLFVLGGCKIGKIEARGDLFSRMDGPPPPLDSKAP
jgi:hypothetical protein